MCVEQETNEAKQKRGYHPLAARYAHSKANEMSFNIVDLIESPNNTKAVSITVNLNESIQCIKEQIVNKLSTQTQKRIYQEYESKKQEFAAAAAAAAAAAVVVENRNKGKGTKESKNETKEHPGDNASPAPSPYRFDMSFSMPQCLRSGCPVW